jgi:hypothetical protein
MELWEPEGALMEPATKSHAHVAYWEEREKLWVCGLGFHLYG